MRNMEPERKRRPDPVRTAHKAERRERLIDAVAEAVRHHGAAASMDEIAADVGVAKPILYRYFGSRHGLNAALAERVTGSLTWELQDALARDAGPRALLRVSIDTYLAFVEREPQLYRWLTQWAQTEQPQAVAGLMEQFGDEIAKVLAERLAAFGLDPAPAPTWAHGIVGMVHRAGDRWLDRQDVSRAQLVEQLVTLLWSGVAGYASGS